MIRGWPSAWRLDLTKNVPISTALLVSGGLLTAATLGRLALEPWLEGATPFATFFAALVVAALWGGAVSGITLLLASALVVDYAWLDPVGKLAPNPRTAVILLLYLASGTIILLATLHLRRTLIQLAERDAQLALINRELHHRIGNLLAVVQAITVQTLRQTADSAAAIRSVEGRLAALAASVEFLQPGTAATVRLGDLTQRCLTPFCPAPHRLRTDGADALVPSAAVVGLSLVLHELATNAIKHGAWSNETGVVSVNGRAGSGFLLVWEERGGPVLQGPPTNSGFGSRLLAMAVPEAETALEYRAGGLVFRLHLAAEPQSA